ncbi:UDP-GlcNAc:betaGal beta-1,3-N-acetylglucosaminyltransferase 9 [Echinococcus granulosus]|nr:UDP-GlcNAc:betaGal beta-1,3-N-acetylglucosaminyltransferase 9 [Echinococcus granulosus]
MRLIVWFIRTQPAPTPSAQIVWPMKLSNSRQPYELQFNAIIGSDSAVANLATVESNLVLKGNASSTTLTYADLVKIPDDHWLRPHHPNVYFAHPQALNLTQIKDNLLQQKPIPQLPVNGYMFWYLVISRDVCHPDNPASQMLDFVVVVRSLVANFKRRQEFRKLHSPFTNRNANVNTHLRIGLVLSMGVPRSQQDNLFVRGGKVLNLALRGGERLNAEGLRATAVSFEAERAKHNELVVGDYEDTWYNPTTKTIYSLQWPAAFCRNSRLTFLFIDDGLPISIIILPPEIRANLHHGKSSSISPWSVEKQEVPWAVYPTYMCGAFLLLGFPQLERLAIGMLFTQAFPLEDAYTGVVAARLGLRPGSMYDLVRPEHILTKRPRNLESVEHFPSRI